MPVAVPAPLRCRSATFDDRRTFVVGILNVTPDSFSDGGRHLALDAAVACGLLLADEGADVVDVGGESTRPGAEPLGEEVERARVVPVIEALAPRLRARGVPLSVDTRHGAVARAALDAGAELVNDVSGGSDPALLDAAARAGVPVILGHLRGTPATMQSQIAFCDLFAEVAAELAAAKERAARAGVAQVVVDPGIGFGKTAAHSVELVARAGELGARLGAKVMIGASRKAFLGALAGGAPVGERLAASLAAAACAALRGAAFVRVHDVRPTRDALAVTDAIRSALALPAGAAA